jgi:hypothetical protein
MKEFELKQVARDAGAVSGGASGEEFRFSAFWERRNRASNDRRGASRA